MFNVAERKLINYERKQLWSSDYKVVKDCKQVKKISDQLSVYDYLHPEQETIHISRDTNRRSGGLSTLEKTRLKLKVTETEERHVGNHRIFFFLQIPGLE